MAASSVPPPATDAPSRPMPGWLPGLVLVVCIFIAYMRVWHAGFIWDDDDHLTRNPCIVGPLGFGAIWTSSKAVYYPLVLTSFWVQHAIWGLNPLPYHVVDVALHALCALLLWRLLRRMQVTGAWLGAAIWALHPVQVESAAWITEQKNTQSCVFYLLAIWFFLKWRAASLTPDPEASFPRAKPYAAALICATLAILSKSSTVMLPVVLGLCWWWMEGRWRWKNAFWLAPFLTVSALASAWTIWEQKYANHALGAEWSQSWPQRAIVAGKDIWFYLWKLIWPHPLTFIYPVWTTDASRATEYLPLLAVGIVGLLLWFFRDGQARPVFFAMAYFVISLFPVLSFFNVYFFRYSFVGDHFQYLASIGPLALAGAAITAGCRRIGGEKGLVYPIISGALLAVLGMLTWLQCGVYQNLETLWRATLADNPNAWIAHFNLGDILLGEGKLDEAAEQFRAQLRVAPRSEEGMGNLANVLLLQGHTEAAVAEFQQLLQIDPNSAEGHGDLAAALLREGRVDEAIVNARQAVELGRYTDDSGHGHNSAGMLRVLAAAYGKASRYSDAVETAKMALECPEAQGNLQLTAALQRELAGYAAGEKASGPRP